MYMFGVSLLVVFVATKITLLEKALLEDSRTG